jgi:NAD(P)-dependent dehydrogenase (short-subunit alcohol dehydrogenase family)
VFDSFFTSSYRVVTEAFLSEQRTKVNMDLPDLSLGLSGTHVLVTGGAGFIGSAAVRAFLAAGAVVSALDIDSDKIAAFPKHDRLFWQNVDITSESAMESAFEKARRDHGVVQVCVALASIDYSYLVHHASLAQMPLSQWRRTMQVNVEGTFLTARTWLRQMGEHALSSTTALRNWSLVIIGSEAADFGITGNADYSAGKAAVQIGLVQSLKADVARIHAGARVNAVAPGAVDTAQFQRECQEDPRALWREAQATTALPQPVPVEAVAKSVLFLASENWSSHVTGQVIPVDSGKQGKVHWMPGEK